MEGKEEDPAQRLAKNQRGTDTTVVSLQQAKCRMFQDIGQFHTSYQICCFCYLLTKSVLLSVICYQIELFLVSLYHSVYASWVCSDGPSSMSDIGKLCLFLFPLLVWVESLQFY